MFKMTATYRTGIDQPQHIYLSATVATEEEARAIAARFPKSAGIKATTLTSHNGGATLVQGYLRMGVRLVSDGVNGGVNETGLRRYRSFRRAAEKLGLDVEYTTPYSNSYATEAAFEAAISAN